MAELRFRVGAIFPADNPTARYVMAISIVLGDLRTAAAQAARTDAGRRTSGCTSADCSTSTCVRGSASP